MWFRRRRTEHEEEVARGESRKAIAITLFVLIVIVPIFMEWEHGDHWFGPHEQTLIAAIGGALAGLILLPHERFAGLVCGALSGAGCSIATVHYLADRDYIWNIEVVVPVVVGCLPGFVLYLGHSIWAERVDRDR